MNKNDILQCGIIYLTETKEQKQWVHCTVGTVSSGIKRISSNQVLLIQMHLINSPSASVSTSMKADVLAVCFFGVVECSRRKDISNVMNEAKCHILKSNILQ